MSPVPAAAGPPVFSNPSRSSSSSHISTPAPAPAPLSTIRKGRLRVVADIPTGSGYIGSSQDSWGHYSKVGPNAANQALQVQYDPFLGDQSFVVSKIWSHPLK